MPWEILRKGILSAFLIHLFLFIMVAIPSSNPPRKKFVRISLYPVSDGKAIEKTEGLEGGGDSEKIKIESPKEERKEKTVEFKKEEPQKPEPVKREKYKTQEKKVEKPKKKDRQNGNKKISKKPEGKKGGGKGGPGKGEKKLSQKPSEIDITAGSGKGGEIVEEVVPEDLKSVYGSILWKMVKEKWEIVSSLKGKSLKVEVLVKISADGKILERRVEKTSGNSTFDVLALNLIDSIESFPPPPWSPKKPVEIIFIFSSE